MPDYIPTRDEQFVTWMQNYVAVLSVHAMDLGVSADDLTALSSSRTSLDAAITEQESKKQAAKAATAAKKADRDTAETLVRSVTRRIVVSPNMTDELRAELGITVPSEQSSSEEIGEEVPMLYLQTFPGRVIVHFGIAVQGERSRVSKPDWASACLIYRKKTGESEYTLMGSARATPFMDDITGPAADYTYVARYQGKTPSELGAQSQAATVAARGELAA